MNPSTAAALGMAVYGALAVALLTIGWGRFRERNQDRLRRMLTALALLAVSQLMFVMSYASDASSWATGAAHILLGASLGATAVRLRTNGERDAGAS